MTYSPKHRANVVRPIGLDPRNNADCACERIAVRKLRGTFCPRHEPDEYSKYNAEHRTSYGVPFSDAFTVRRGSAANSHNESARSVTSMYALDDYQPKHSIESDGGFW